MSKNDQEEAYEKLLAGNLSRIIDFLKFAEAKNAALLTFSSAWTLAIIGVLSSQRNVPSAIATGLVVSLPLFASATVVAMVSFIPKISLAAFRARPKNPPNLLFFGDVARIATDEYSSVIRKRYFPADEHTVREEYVADLSIQIAVNSRIANRKFHFFDWGARLVLFALTVLTVTSAAQALV